MDEIIVSPIVKQSNEQYKLNYRITWIEGNHTSGFVFVPVKEFSQMNYSDMQEYIASSVSKGMTRLIGGNRDGN